MLNFHLKVETERRRETNALGVSSTKYLLITKSGDIVLRRTSAGHRNTVILHNTILEILGHTK